MLVFPRRRILIVYIVYRIYRLRIVHRVYRVYRLRIPVDCRNRTNMITGTIYRIMTA